MRIIIILLVVALVYITLKSLFTKNTKKSSGDIKAIKYCKYCKAYVALDELCSAKNNDYKNCKNYKWDWYEQNTFINDIIHHHGGRYFTNYSTSVKKWGL